MDKYENLGPWQSKKKKTINETDWPEIFDLLSREYGWTTEYILSRTYKEIEYRLYYIDRRLKIEQANKIMLAGGKAKIAIPKRRIIAKKEEKSFDEIIQEQRINNAFNRKVQEWNKK